MYDYACQGKQSIDFAFLGKLLNLCFCLMGQAGSLILHTLRSSVSLAKASKIMDFAYLCKLPNL
jgi:hypothetical protein